jgi:hypothetical protein
MLLLFSSPGFEKFFEDAGSPVDQPQPGPRIRTFSGRSLKSTTWNCSRSRDTEG